MTISVDKVSLKRNGDIVAAWESIIDKKERKSFKTLTEYNCKTNQRRAYSVTKAANTQFIRMIAQQYADKGIRANTVVPGLIDIPRIANTVAKMFSKNGLEARAARDRQVPIGRSGTAWEVAHACAFLVSDAASYITGTELVVDGGITGKYV